MDKWKSDKELKSAIFWENLYWYIKTALAFVGLLVFLKALSDIGL